MAHPDIADDYREARKIRADVVGRTSGGRDAGTDSEEHENSEEHESSEDDSRSNGEATENLRQAIRKYRAVYKKLLEN